MKVLTSILSLALLNLASASQGLISRQTTAATGDSSCSNYMCIAATLNGSTVEYVMSSTGKRTPGWMGIGFGRQMGNTPMVIMWSNSDGSFTVSQRQAPSEVEPTVVDNPPRVATLLNNVSTTSGDGQYAFSIPSDGSTTVNLIWAFGLQNPNNDAVDADLQQHYDMGNAQLDLTKALSSNGSTPDSSSGSSSSSSSSDDDSLPLLPYQRLIVAHAIFCTVGFLLFLPAGALLARYLRTFTPVWFTGHWIAQFVVSGPTIIIGFALGVQAVVKAGAPQFNDDHKKWGLAIFILYLVQCGLGAVIHWVKPKSAGRPPQNYLHAVLGLLIIALALYQVRTGYKTEWPRTTGRGEIMNSANIIWYVWVVLLPVLYFAGLALLPRQFKQEKEYRHRKAPSNSSNDDIEEIDMQNRYRD